MNTTLPTFVFLIFEPVVMKMKHFLGRKVVHWCIQRIPSSVFLIAASLRMLQKARRVTQELKIRAQDGHNRSSIFVSFGVNLKRKFKIIGFKSNVQPLGHPLDFLQNSQGCSNNKWRRVVAQIVGLVFSKVNWTKFRWHFILIWTSEQVNARLWSFFNLFSF